MPLQDNLGTVLINSFQEFLHYNECLPANTLCLNVDMPLLCPINNPMTLF